MAKLFPIILLLLGIVVGGGAGHFLKPAEEVCSEPACEEEAKETESEDPAAPEATYVAMKNQFVVPVIEDGRVKSMIVLSLSLETNAEDNEIIYSKEPKLRDVFLRTLFDHAHIGGFDGAFTESGRLSILRIALLEVAQSVIGEEISDILITDIVRQEM